MKLNLLLTYKSKSQKDLADYLGVSTAAVTRWFKKDRSFPNDRIDEICEKLEVSRHFFDNIGSLITEENTIVNEVIPIATAQGNNINVIELAQPALASFFVNLEDDKRIARQAYMPGLPERDAPYYAMEVSGDSMYPHLAHGDWIYAELITDKQTALKPQTIYAIAIGGNMLVKWVRILPDTEIIELISANPIYPPMRENLSEVHAILKIIAVLKKV